MFTVPVHLCHPIGAHHESEEQHHGWHRIGRKAKHRNAVDSRDGACEMSTSILKLKWDLRKPSKAACQHAADQVKGEEL